jgi:hypothetical protein
MKTKELFEKAEGYKIYLDLDGVIADFAGKSNEICHKYIGPDFHMKLKQFVKNGASKEDREKFWKAVEQYQDEGNELWYKLEPLEDARYLVTYLRSLGLPLEILSATGPPEYGAKSQKVRWVRDHFGNIKVNTVRRAPEKAEYACEKCILIDDMEYAIEPFEKAGGIGILHTTAKNTINKIKKLLG